MAAKLISSILTLFGCVAIGVLGLFSLLLAMNGYHENDGIYGLGFFVIAGLLISIGFAIIAWFATSKLAGRGWHSVLSVVTPTIVLVVIAAVLKTIAMFIAIGIAEFVRVNY